MIFSMGLFWTSMEGCGSDMVPLPQSQHAALHASYLDHSAYFPLIAAVLIGDQNGKVYVDCEEKPTQAYVEHSFGFAQVFGKSVPGFERALRRYWLVDKEFTCPKVRLYTPFCPDFLKSGEFVAMRSWRQHFQLGKCHIQNPDEPRETTESDVYLLQADASHIDMIESFFGVAGRFWRTTEDFVRCSNAILAFVKGQPAALCYAAAVAGGKAEIDVLTLPSYRQLGLAKAVVLKFNQQCLKQNILPLWDCFTNNAASMGLCQATGFVSMGDPYPFFTINR
jgi:hypothetical protein